MQNWKIFSNFAQLFKTMAKTGIITIPSLVDLHVHFREPGYTEKETIATGSAAAKAAGYSDVFTMPNLKPAPDTLEHLRIQMDIIASDAAIAVHPYASITLGQTGEGELVDMEALAPYVAGFSDDGVGVKDEKLMREAMLRCKAVNRVIVEHCEVRGIPAADPRSEYLEIERNIRLAEETGCRLHICHISTKESVALIRSAKSRGVLVTCETCPHYLLLNDRMVEDSGDFKMNPPIRSVADQMALIAGIQDGTIDCIATDHAPHTAEEKSRGFAGSLNGIVGIETAFPLCYTYLVKTGIIPLDRLVELMSLAPRRIMGLTSNPDRVTFDVETEYEIDPDSFISKGHSTPFKGWKVVGRKVKG